MKILLTLISLLILASTTYATNSHAEEVHNHDDVGLSSGEMTKNIIGSQKVKR